MFGGISSHSLTNVHFILAHRPLGQTFKDLFGSFTIRPQAVESTDTNTAATTNTKDYIQYNHESTPEVVKEIAQLKAQAKMSEAEQPKPNEPVDANDAAADNEASGEKGAATTSSLQPRKSYKYDDPPIVFKEIDVSVWLFVYIAHTNIMITVGHRRPGQGGGDGDQSTQPAATVVSQGDWRVPAVGLGRLGHR